MGPFADSWKALRNMLDGFVGSLPKVAVALFVFGLFVLAAAGIRALVHRLATEKRRHRNLGIVLGRLTYGVVVLIGLLAALTIVFPSFQVADLIGVLGLGTVAVGFAFRDILQNFLAGIILLLTEPFRIGDQIVLGAFEGTVENIESRATFIRTYDGRRAIIPNATLLTESVTVNTAFEKRRSSYDVGIGLGDDVARTKELMLEAMRGVEGVLPEPAPEALVVELADFSVKVRALWWTEPPQRINILRVQDAVLSAIKDALIAHGIDLPFPTHQILLHDQTEETDGDRARQREGWPAGDGARPVPRPRPISAALERLARGGEPHR